MSEIRKMPSASVCPSCASEQAKIEEAEHARLMKCLNCDLVFAVDREVPFELYDEAYTESGEYAAYLSTDDRQREPHLPWAMRQFLKDSGANKLLLDVGCSAGSFIQAAERKDWRVSGLELSETAAAVAKERTGAPVYTGSLTSYLPDKPLDAVTAWEVLEHIPDPRQFMIQTVSLLAQGGVLALSVPNWNSPWMKSSDSQQHWPPFHLNYWNRKSLQYVFEESGLVDISIREKPFAWEEEVGQRKWAYLPIALIRSTVLKQKGMHLYAIGTRK